MTKESFGHALVAVIARTLLRLLFRVEVRGTMEPHETNTRAACVEAELIEPYLYPLQGPEFGAKLAEAVLTRG